jgi:hypothetical protein
MRMMILSFSLLTLAGVSAQRLGVNTTTPVSTLDVQSQGSGSLTGALSVSNSNNDTLLYLRDDGRLGIGTTTPSVALDVITSGSVAARFSAPVEGQPALNANELVTLGQLQAVSAGGQSSANFGSNATMWSLSVTPSAGWHSNALLFCRNLTEGGFNDWRLPTMLDIFKLVSDNSVPLPSYAPDNYWLIPATFVNASTGSIPYLIVSQPSFSNANPFYYSTVGSSSNMKGFCVR